VGFGGAAGGFSSSGEFSPSSVPVFSTSTVRSFAETVSLCGTIGRTTRQRRIAIETSKTDAFGVPITRRQYTKRH
jgi:hypothetical protein